MPGGSTRLTISPTTIPGSVIAFGSRWCSRSIAKSAISAVAKATRTTISADHPNSHRCRRNISIVRISTMG